MSTTSLSRFSTHALPFSSSIQALPIIFIHANSLLSDRLPSGGLEEPPLPLSSECIHSTQTTLVRPVFYTLAEKPRSMNLFLVGITDFISRVWTA